MLERSAVWYRVQALGHAVSVSLETETAMWTIKQSCLCGGALIKTLDTKAWVSFSGWKYSVHVFTHYCWENKSTRLYWERTIGNFSWTLPYVPFAFADFNLHYFDVINHNHEHYRFWVLWVFLVNQWTCHRGDDLPFLLCLTFSVSLNADKNRTHLKLCCKLRPFPQASLPRLSLSLMWAWILLSDCSPLNISLLFSTLWNRRPYFLQ